MYGIVLAAQAEFAHASPRINEMRIYALVTRHGGEAGLLGGLGLLQKWSAQYQVYLFRSRQQIETLWSVNERGAVLL